MRTPTVLSLALGIALAAAPALAERSPLGVPTYGQWQPAVPVSRLGNPAAWLDPSRLRVSTSVSVGSFGGGTDALQVTSLSYRFRSPLMLSVSLGNTWGPGAAAGGRSSFFLEGLRLSWQPSAGTLFQFQYRDLRSPLQYGHGYGPWGHDPHGLPLD
jgi:hypothetical protein